MPGNTVHLSEDKELRIRHIGDMIAKVNSIYVPNIICFYLYFAFVSFRPSTTCIFCQSCGWGQIMRQLGRDCLEVTSWRRSGTLLFPPVTGGCCPHSARGWPLCPDTPSSRWLGAWTLLSFNKTSWYLETVFGILISRGYTEARRRILGQKGSRYEWYFTGWVNFFLNVF